MSRPPWLSMALTREAKMDNEGLGLMDKSPSLSHKASEGFALWSVTTGTLGCTGGRIQNS